MSGDRKSLLHKATLTSPHPPIRPDQDTDEELQSPNATSLIRSSRTAAPPTTPRCQRFHLIDAAQSRSLNIQPSRKSSLLGFRHRHEVAH
ncbi:hypothetical protein BJ508DRAFT_416389 [Ascobolus immersus RN42]|uniref:Uncharacterized protein n=1 Tax=Ascobolus immersus RN42 TaxID=1160509 RepID=A0A3N4HY75_ASCIM|nr:hypothetical protein BJ508DRAFT_416389 [Ascobolus immersus RN42]